MTEACSGWTASTSRRAAPWASASVVGMVGAGGIGMVLWDVIRGFEYAQTAAVLIMLAVSVSLIDLLSSQLRRRLA